MRKLRLLVFLFLALPSTFIHAQVENGSIAPDFYVQDLDGNEWWLTNELDQGRTVVICIGATWALPVWEYINEGVLQEFYEMTGPLGENTATTLFIEADASSPLDELYGNGNSQGNYVNIINFPITEADESFAVDYMVNAYPTIYMICPDGVITEMGQPDIDTLLDYMWNDTCIASGTMEYNPALDNLSYIQNCGAINPQVTLMNYGSEPLTTCDILVTTSTGYSETITWTGYLETNEYDIVQLGSFNLESAYTLTAALDISSTLPGENILNTNVNVAANATSHIQLDLLTDNYPEEIYWAIYDESEVVVASGTAEIAAAQIVSDIFLNAEGCYRFEITDSWGDGLAWEGDITGHCYLNYIQEDGDVFPIYIYLGDHWYDIEFADFEVTEIVPVSLTGYVYQDLNENGYQDNDENGIGGIPVSLDALTTYSNEDGSYIFNDVESSLSSLSIDWDNTVYPTNTTPASYDLSAISLYSYSFGLSTNDPNYNLNYQFGNPWFFCGMDGNLWFSVSNHGNQVCDGSITVTLDPLLNYIAASPVPTTVNGNVYSWDIQQLGLGETFYYSIAIAAPDFNSMGEEISCSVALSSYDENNAVVDEDSGTYTTILACSYDPNDKQGTPLGETDAHFIMNGTSLEYLVRFQNTGNYQAFNIHVLDEIDEDLNLGSFELISTSHYCQPTINSESREIDFFFPDINLPDSNANEVGSHGFIRYRISMNPDLAEMSTINNTAFIYFDANPAVITNTTLHTVSDLFFGVEENAGLTLSIYPNPANALVSIQLPEPIGTFQVIATDITGKQTFSLGNFSGRRATIDTAALPAGTYFIRLVSNSEKQNQPAKLVVIR